MCTRTCQVVAVLSLQASLDATESLNDQTSFVGQRRGAAILLHHITRDVEVAQPLPWLKLTIWVRGFL